CSAGVCVVRRVGAHRALSRCPRRSLSSLAFQRRHRQHRHLYSFPTRRSSDLAYDLALIDLMVPEMDGFTLCKNIRLKSDAVHFRSEEHTSELQSRFDLVCRLLLAKKNATRSRYKCASTKEPKAFTLQGLAWTS